MHSNEEWRCVVGQEGLYVVSSNGNVRSVTRWVGARAGGQRRIQGRLLSPFKTKWGYLMVSPCTDGERTHMTVHSIVAEAFIGPRPDGYDVNHKNGIKTDNRAENLEYTTRSKNHIHAYRNGLKHRAILSMEKAREIRSRYAAGGITHAELAEEFNVHRPSIGQVINNKIWREEDGSF